MASSGGEADIVALERGDASSLSILASKAVQSSSASPGISEVLEVPFTVLSIAVDSESDSVLRTAPSVSAAKYADAGK